MCSLPFFAVCLKIYILIVFVETDIYFMILWVEGIAFFEK